MHSDHQVVTSNCQFSKLDVHNFMYGICNPSTTNHVASTFDHKYSTCSMFTTCNSMGYHPEKDGACERCETLITEV